VAPWKRIVLTRSVALAPTLLVALLARSPNKLDVLNQWLNILQSIQLPFAVIPVWVHAYTQLKYLPLPWLNVCWLCTAGIIPNSGRGM
jgi:Mn2+/Fe2+ NRAMP family transporter